MTLGLGGHASGIIAKMHAGDIFIGFDADIENLTQAQKNIQTNIDNPGVILHFVHSNFCHVREKLTLLNINSLTGVYFDLGVSSAHFDDGDRGFSFRFDAPLDMRFDRDSGINAYDVLKDYSKEALSKIFYDFWEEPKTRFIVDAILEARAIKPIETTKELANIIEKSSFDQKSKLRVFQALRMEVNNELWVIKTALDSVIPLLQKEGRICVITFHSLEDRLVKQVFTQYHTDIRDEFTGQTKIPKILEKVHKKPLIPTDTEISENPRSRSAKLRVVEKI